MLLENTAAISEPKTFPYGCDVTILKLPGVPVVVPVLTNGGEHHVGGQTLIKHLHGGLWL